MFKNYKVKNRISNISSIISKNKTSLFITLFFITGFFMHSLIAEDVENENELALMEAIEARVETKLTTMENEKTRQDTINDLGISPY